MRKLLIMGLAAVVAAGAGAAEAVSPRNWVVTGVEGWGGTTREAAGVTSDGTLRPALTAEPVEDLEAFTIWDLVLDGKDVVAGTGDAGALYRVSAGGEIDATLTAIQPELTAVARDARGRILAGATPDGVVYRQDGERLRQVADTPEIYVWDILPRPDGGALVATGTSGRIYRMDESGELSVLADPGCEHVNAVRPYGDGFLATTESPGRLLRIDEKGQVTVLHDASEPELRSPVVLGDGTIYFLANPGSPGSPGRLYRRAVTGAVEPVWSSLEGWVYELSADADGMLWVAAGSDTGSGALVRVEPGPPSRWMEMVKVSEPQVLCMAPAEGTPAWLGTGGLGRLYRVTAAPSPAGTVRSEVHDAGAAARWGSLSLEPGWRAGGTVAETRSGNTASPDDGWSDWEPVALADGRGAVPSPPARFLQWRLTLTEAAAEIGAVRVIYLPANRSPQVAEVSVAEPGAELDLLWDGRGQPSSLGQDLPGGVRVEFQVGGGRNPFPPADDEEAAWARRYRAVTWKASDADGDALRFEVQARAAGEEAWSPLARDLEASPWLWDSAALPDGWYALRVLASDETANPRGQGLSAHRVSEPVLVDNTPPAVANLRVSQGVLTGRTEDAAGPIRRIELAVDGGPWTTVFPEDGIPDMPRETVRVELDELEPGEHVALVRAVDQAGNIGTGRVSFRTP